MGKFLKRLFFFTIALIGSFIIIINGLFFIFKADALNVFLQKEQIVKIEKIKGFFLPFYINLAGFSYKDSKNHFYTEGIILKNKILLAIMGRPFIDLELKGIDASINSQGEAKFDFDPLVLLQLFKRIDVSNSELFYNGDFVLKAPVTSLAYDYSEGLFNCKADNVVLEKGKLKEDLKILIKAEFASYRDVFLKGYISGRYINLQIKKPEIDGIILLSGKLEADLFKIFGINVDGKIDFNGFMKKRDFDLTLASNLTYEGHTIKVYGNIKKDRDILNYILRDINFDDFSMSSKGSYNASRNRLKGRISIKRYENKLKYFKFFLDFKKGLFNVNARFKSLERYELVGKIKYKNSKIDVKRISLKSTGSTLKTYGHIDEQGAYFKLKGNIAGNRDIKKYIGDHNINVQGDLKYLKDNSVTTLLNVNFTEYFPFTVKEVKAAISYDINSKTSNGHFNVAMNNGFARANVFYDNVSFKGDYYLKGLNLSQIAPVMGIKGTLNGYGIIKYENGFSGSGNISYLYENKTYITSYAINDNAFTSMTPHIARIDIYKLSLKDGLKCFVDITSLSNKLKASIRGSVASDFKKTTYDLTADLFKNFSFTTTGSYNDKKLEGRIAANNEIHKRYISQFDYKVDFSQNISTIYSVIHLQEKYILQANLKFDKKSIFLENVSLMSGASKLLFEGSIGKEHSIVKLNGIIVDNGDLKRFLNVEHKIGIDGQLGYSKGSLTASLNLKPSTYLMGIVNASLSGELSLKDQALNARGNIDFGSGTLNLAGSGKIGERLVATVDYNNIPLYNVAAIINQKIPETASMSGSNKIVFDKTLNITGSTAIKKLFFKELSADYNYENGIIAFNNLTIDRDRFDNPGSINIAEKTIDLHIDKDSVKNDLFAADNVTLMVNGSIYNPSVDVQLTLINLPTGNSFISLKGNLNHISFIFKSKLLVANLDVLNKGKGRDIKVILNAAYKDIVNLAFKSDVSPFTEGSYRSYSEDVQFTLFKNIVFTLKDVSFLFNKKGIRNFNATIRNNICENVRLDNFSINRQGIKGKIDFNKAILSYKEMLLLKTSGIIDLFYGYKGLPSLSGQISASGDFFYKDIGLKMPVKSLVLTLNDKVLILKTNMSYLDSNLSLDYKTKNYAEYLEGELHLRGEHIYINKSGFSGLVDVVADYNADQKKLEGHIHIVKADYIFSNVASNGRSVENIKLPITLDLDIKTLEPIKVTSDFVVAGVNLDLNLIYKDKINLTGKMISTDTSVVIGREKFIINNNYILFSEKRPPYLYLEASGAGSYSYVILKIHGFLPNYSIEIINLDPNNAGSMETESSYNPQNLFTDVFTGLLLNDLLNITENIIGINKIGFEQRTESGEYVNYLKIGRQFSDRFEVKYVVGAEKQEQEGSLVGEYILLDWLKLSLFSQNTGGTGFGFTFFTDF